MRIKATYSEVESYLYALLINVSEEAGLFVRNKLVREGSS